MAETCAGSIYNALDCPKYDVERGNQFASLGETIPGMILRISDAGEVQLFGFMVFEECCNDLVNTKLAFTSDGWFRTGDMRNLDGNGRLSLTGRQKDIVIING
jgi:long-subunit acyl-CoA synthetase (AMP-forming)